MKRMKKTILGSLTMSAVAIVPIVTVVACSDYKIQSSTSNPQAKNSLVELKNIINDIREGRVENIVITLENEDGVKRDFQLDSKNIETQEKVIKKFLGYNKEKNNG